MVSTRCYCLSFHFLEVFLIETRMSGRHHDRSKKTLTATAVWLKAMGGRSIHLNTPEALALRCCKGHTAIRKIGHNKFPWIKVAMIDHLHRLTYTSCVYMSRIRGSTRHLRIGSGVWHSGTGTMKSNRCSRKSNGLSSRRRRPARRVVYATARDFRTDS